MTDISLNGNPRQVEHDSLIDLVADVTGKSAHELLSGALAIAVARNAFVVPRWKWRETPLEAGDEIELVTALQGG